MRIIFLLLCGVLGFFNREGCVQAVGGTQEIFRRAPAIRGCYDKWGMYHLNGSWWKRGCNTHLCQNGIITASSTPCPPVKCEARLQLQGRCCTFCLREERLAEQATEAEIDITPPGKLPDYPMPRIVGGEDADRDELPYQVHIDIGGGLCGGSVYKENWIISAAHCFYGKSPSDVEITAGTRKPKALISFSRQKRYASEIKIHQSYDPSTQSNDIALLKLKKSLKINKHVKTVSLPASGHGASGNCLVSGWGTTSEGGSVSSVLQKVTVPMVSHAECQNNYAGKGTVDGTMICAGYTYGGKDSCQGDSGGPLVCSDTGSNYLAGVVSWGIGCARSDYPGVYSEVSHFVNWIKDKTSATTTSGAYCSTCSGMIMIILCPIALYFLIF
ncbi:hypothetical protein SK128_019589 [Halocaridina rubra]|uniref:Peptidase S1 domain-containing protein n=1 Tax=Halocaridina rubra TaxID=373956 RepID=A0AAN9AET5_HALRR